VTTPGICKPLPPEQFVHHDTNAEMRWDTVDPAAALTTQERLFVRSHTSTPTIDAATYRLRIFGDGLVDPLTADQALTFGYDDLRSLGEETCTGVFECTGNGRSFFDTQQGRPAPGTQWRLGSVGAVEWIGVPLSVLLDRVALDPQAASIQATGLDPHYVDEDGVDHGHVRRPLPVDKAIADTFLAWGADGKDLLPDHGFPVRLVVPGWVGIASIKWLGSLEVSTAQLTSPWNTQWYRMTGPEHPADSPPLTLNPCGRPSSSSGARRSQQPAACA
jgi:DMSO/TMAO reductase YedYZ molybdopterin-dependent catalytic subunit